MILLMTNNREKLPEKISYSDSETMKNFPKCRGGSKQAGEENIKVWQNPSFMPYLSRTHCLMGNAEIMTNFRCLWKIVSPSMYSSFRSTHIQIRQAQYMHTISSLRASSIIFFFHPAVKECASLSFFSSFQDFFEAWKNESEM